YDVSLAICSTSRFISDNVPASPAQPDQVGGTAIVRRLGREVSTEATGVLVLGMHRSGTSAATRLINMLGPATCRADDILRGAWNPSGHYESRTLVRLDNELLGQMGRTWWYPPPTGEEYLALAGRIKTSKAKARRVFRRVHPGRPWVWK